MTKIFAKYFERGEDETSIIVYFTDIAPYTKYSDVEVLDCGA